MKNSKHSEAPCSPRNRAPGLRRKARRAHRSAQIARAHGRTWDAAMAVSRALEFELLAADADSYAEAMRDTDPAGFADEDLHSIADAACTVHAGERY